MNDHHTFLSRPIANLLHTSINDLLWGDIEMSYAYSIVHSGSFDKIIYQRVCPREVAQCRGKAAIQFICC